MGNVIQMNEFHGTWDKIFCDDSDDVLMDVYVNSKTKELEILLFNDEGECIRKVLSLSESANLHRVTGNIKGQK